MRKRTMILPLLILCLVIALLPQPVQASGSAAFSMAVSSGTVRVGDTIMVTGRISASAMVATFDLDVKYNPGQLQYVKAEAQSPIQAGELDFGVSSGSIQVLYLDNDGGTSGITSGNLFRLTFKVIGGQPGETTNLSYSIRTVGDATASAMSASGSGAGMTIAAPLSTNNNLASLAVSPGSLSPVFSPAVTQYSMSVPFDVSRIDVRAAAADGSATININSPGLAAGGNTNLTVTVTAASGAQRTYSIRVSRAQDPNYVPSDNADLGALSVDGFLLSPSFAPNRTDYAIYLPYEIDVVSVQASAADAKASVVSISGQDELEAGSINPIEIIVRAEDNSTQIYRIVAVRAQLFTTLEELGLLVTEPEPSPSPTPEPVPTEPVVTSQPQPTADPEMTEQPDANTQQPDSAGPGVAWILVFVLAFLLVTAAVAILWLVLRLRKISKS